MTFRASFGAGCAWMLACGVGAAALATPTDPTLALTATASAAGGAGRVLRIDGSFHAQDLVQLAYPIQVLVRVGTSYVRFDLSAGAVSGSAPELADGLQENEAQALLGAGAPAPDARVLFLGLGRLELALPESFPGGPAEAQLFVIDGGAVILSNALPLTLEASP